MVRRWLLLTAHGAAGSWLCLEKVRGRAWSPAPGFRAAGEPAVRASAGPCQGLQQLHGTPQPSQVPQSPLKIMVVFGEMEAQRRREKEPAELMQQGRSRAGKRIGDSQDPSEAGAWLEVGDQ